MQHETADAPAVHALHEHRINTLEQAVVSISASLQTLVRLEAQHAESNKAIARAWSAIEASNRRTAAIENEMPTLKLARRLVFGACFGGMGLLLTAIAMLVIRH